MTIPQAKRLFEMNDRVLRANLAGIGEEDARKLLGLGGNNLNWILGHLLVNRETMVDLLQGEPFWSRDDVAVYQRGSHPDQGVLLPWKEILEAWDRSQSALMNALSGSTDDDLERPTEKEQTVGETLEGFHFHETYHIGQLGLLRRMIGKQGAIR